jgi:hypothetical protein
MADSNPFDQAARYFARLDPAGMLAWAMDSSIEEFRFAGWRDTRSIPFPGEPDRVSDLVANLERLEPPGQPWLIPVEVQIEPDPLMFGRLLEYLGRLWRTEKPSAERGDHFWLAAVVINLTGNGRSSRDFEWSSGGPKTCLRVAEKNVEALSAARTLADVASGTTTRAVLALVPLMQGGAESGIIEEWKRLASLEPDSRRRSDFGALAIIFAEAVGFRDRWKDALKEWNMTESKQVLEWQTEGEVRGKASAVIGVLEARFQVIPGDLTRLIQSLTEIQRLSRLVALAATTSSLDQFRADAGL